MCMIEMAEPWQVYEEKQVTARKPHACGECQRTIEPGERYEQTSALGDGSWQRYRTCRHCLAARAWLSAVCNGWIFGFVLEELEEHWDEDLLYRGFWLGRAILGMRRKWRGLEPLPDPCPGLLAAGLIKETA